MPSYLPISQLPKEPGLVLGVAKPVAPPEPADLVNLAKQILEGELRSWQARTGPTRTCTNRTGPSQRP
jgi:hypothetical protein